MVLYFFAKKIYEYIYIWVSIVGKAYSLQCIHAVFSGYIDELSLYNRCDHFLIVSSYYFFASRYWVCTAKSVDPEETVCFLPNSPLSGLSFPPLQVALRRQQAQEEELGICSPVTLSGPEVMVKNEAGADCLFSVDGRSLTPTSTCNSSLAVTGEVLPTVIRPLSHQALSCVTALAHNWFYICTAKSLCPNNSSGKYGKNIW